MKKNPLPASGNLLLQQSEHFQSVVQAWQQADKRFHLKWEYRSFRHFGEQYLPVSLIISDFANLIEILGEPAQSQAKHWQTIITCLLANLPLHEHLFACLIDELPKLELFNDSELQLLIELIPQLHADMGKEAYLRALPVVRVDSKFIEQHFTLIENLLAVYDSDIKEQGLLLWLNCKAKPKDWLLVKPLCASSRQASGGLPILRL